MAVSIPKVRGYKNENLVDAPFLISREISLVKPPRTDTENVFLNGLILATDCYSISGSVLTIDPGLPIEVDDVITVSYLS